MCVCVIVSFEFFKDSYKDRFGSDELFLVSFSLNSRRIFPRSLCTGKDSFRIFTHLIEPN